MTDSSLYLTQIKEAIALLKDSLLPYLSSNDMRQCETQLKGVEQTIRQLHNTNTPIPSELRNLKLKLVNELEEYNFAHKAYSEYSMLIHKEQAIIFATSRSGQNKGENGKTRIYPLLSAGFLPDNVTIYGYHGKRRHEAIINANGFIIQKIGDQEIVSSTPSKAAGNITLGSVNGWTWWKTSFEGEEHDLAYYRNLHEQHGRTSTK